MKATVLAAPENDEPRLAMPGEAEDLEGRGIEVADLDVVPERSLRVAVWALQRIHSTSACPGSRRTADQALRLIGQREDLPTAPSGMPEPVAMTHAELDPHNLQNPWVLEGAH